MPFFNKELSKAIMKRTKLGAKIIGYVIQNKEIFVSRFKGK